MADELVTLETFRFLPEAEAARMHLEAEGITVLLADAEIINMDWLLGNALGYIKLRVPRSQAEAAMTLLSRRQAKRQSRAADSEEPDSTSCLVCGQKIPDDALNCPACGWSYAGAEDA